MLRWREVDIINVMKITKDCTKVGKIMKVKRVEAKLSQVSHVLSEVQWRLHEYAECMYQTKVKSNLDNMHRIYKIYECNIRTNKKSTRGSVIKPRITNFITRIQIAS